ncbi:hypothetical protein PMIN06_002138 [Paraphaeosphaeria minitans]
MLPGCAESRDADFIGGSFTELRSRIQCIGTKNPFQLLASHDCIILNSIFMSMSARVVNHFPLFRNLFTHSFRVRLCISPGQASLSHSPPSQATPQISSPSASPLSAACPPPYTHL